MWPAQNVRNPPLADFASHAYRLIALIEQRLRLEESDSGGHDRAEARQTDCMMGGVGGYGSSEQGSHEQAESADHQNRGPRRALPEVN